MNPMNTDCGCATSTETNWKTWPVLSMNCSAVSSRRTVCWKGMRNSGGSKTTGVWSMRSSSTSGALKMTLTGSKTTGVC
jgi:hypothetical protein